MKRVNIVKMSIPPKFKYICIYVCMCIYIYGSDGKASACNVGNLGSIPVSGISPREGNGNPFHYSCLENSMDGGAW